MFGWLVCFGYSVCWGQTTRLDMILSYHCSAFPVCHCRCVVVICMCLWCYNYSFFDWFPFESFLAARWTSYLTQQRGCKCFQIGACDVMSRHVIWSFVLFCVLSVVVMTSSSFLSLLCYHSVDSGHGSGFGSGHAHTARMHPDTMWKARIPICASIAVQVDDNTAQTGTGSITKAQTKHTPQAQGPSQQRCASYPHLFVYLYVHLCDGMLASTYMVLPDATIASTHLLLSHPCLPSTSSPHPCHVTPITSANTATHVHAWWCRMSEWGNDIPYQPVSGIRDIMDIVGCCARSCLLSHRIA